MHKRRRTETLDATILRVTILRDIRGSFGLTLAERGECLLIAGVDESSSAHRLGVRTGMRLIAIGAARSEPRNVAGLTLRALVSTLSEHAGVTLRLVRATAAQLSAAPARCNEAEDAPVQELRRLLTSDQINELHALACTFRQWRSAHVYLTGLHEALFLHAEGFFEKAAPTLLAALTTTMRSHYSLTRNRGGAGDDGAGGGGAGGGDTGGGGAGGGGEDGSEGKVGDDNGTHVLGVRCIEYHEYKVGGALLEENHRDVGSELTLSVLLTDAGELDGGTFVTYDADGTPVTRSRSPTRPCMTRFPAVRL